MINIDSYENHFWQNKVDSEIILKLIVFLYLKYFDSIKKKPQVFVSVKHTYVFTCL